MEALADHPNHDRWQQAQNAELQWWRDWPRLPFYRNHSFTRRWTAVVSELIGDPESLKAQTIVEVGCGPHGVVRYLFENAGLKLGIDPLIAQFDDRPMPDGTTSYAAAMGEMIPVRDDAADVVLCINVLDHVVDARRILQEIRRILKPGGTLLLEVHTFPRILAPLMLLDHPHTYHWTEAGVAAMVREAGFGILKDATESFPIELSWASALKPSQWKYVFGRLFMKLTYIYCRK